MLTIEELKEIWGLSEEVGIYERFSTKSDYIFIGLVEDIPSYLNDFEIDGIYNAYDQDFKIEIAVLPRFKIK